MFKFFSISDLTRVALLLDEEEAQEIEMAKKGQYGSMIFKKKEN